MKTPEIKLLAASLLLFLTASAQALEPELLYGFQLGGQNPRASLVQGSDGNFYGTTSSGGTFGDGTVFQVTSNGGLTTLVSFNGANGNLPESVLVLGPDGNFYGTTLLGGSGGFGDGTVFKVTTNGVLTTLFSFDRYFPIEGAYPIGGLVWGGDGNFYGTTGGGNGIAGTLFKMTTNGVLTTLRSFGDGAGPHAAPVLGSDGNLYGTSGGSGIGGDFGTVFQVTTNGVGTTLVVFNNTNGAHPFGGLVLGSDDNFYGTTYYGGSTFVDVNNPGFGTVFQVTTNGVLTTLVSFNSTNGANPVAGLVSGSDGNFYGTTSAESSSGGGTVFRVTTNGVLTTLVSFNTNNSKATGATPIAGLVLGRDGNFYGTTEYGGSGGVGTVFQVTTSGVLTTLASLGSPNGANPQAGLALGSDGNFYGTTSAGGSGGGVGTVFQVTTNGLLTTLVSFNNTNGAGPNELVLGRDGNFYGTASGGGSGGYGTVFKATTNGLLTRLVSFNNANGANPQAGLVLGRDGKFYGTTENGGAAGFGNVFRVATNGVLTTLVSFNGANGANPQAALVLGSDGKFYGTTGHGGSGPCSDNIGTGCGTVFRVTTNGVLTTLVSFNDTNGRYPLAGLVLGHDGNFYGTTSESGSGFAGTVFKVTTNGVLTTLVSFNSNNGWYPWAGLVLGRDGNFYGTTYQAGYPLGFGNVFQVTTNGVLTTLVSFNDANGANPQAELVLGSDGNFYGTTAKGGPGGGGTIFRLVLPRFTSLARLPGGSILLTGAGPANEGYRLWAATDVSLPFASWTLLTSNSFGSNSTFSYTDAGAAANASRFYQLTVP